MRTDEEFRIPAARDSKGRLVTPESASRRGAYRTDRFLPWLCADHQGERGRTHRAARTERASAAALAKKLPFSIKEFPGFRIAHVATCPSGHAALVFEWDGKDPPWPRPPLVVAVQKDFDWSFGRLKGRPTQTAAWRRAYASACATCGAIVDPRTPPSR